MEWKDVVYTAIGTIVVCLLTVVAIKEINRHYAEPNAYPVACADIPESNQRVVIIRDGQVECHYKITKVKEKK